MKEKLIIYLQQESFERFISGDKIDREIGRQELQEYSGKVAAEERPGLTHLEVEVRAANIAGAKVVHYWEGDSHNDEDEANH